MARTIHKLSTLSLCAVACFTDDCGWIVTEYFPSLWLVQLYNSYLKEAGFPTEQTYQRGGVGVGASYFIKFIFHRPLNAILLPAWQTHNAHAQR